MARREGHWWRPQRGYEAVFACPNPSRDCVSNSKEPDSLMTKTTTASPSAQLSSVSGRARLQRVPGRSGRLMGVVAAIALAAACTGQATNPTEPTATTTTDFSLMFANFHVGPSSTFDVHLFAQGRSGEAFALSSDSPSVTVPAWVTTDDKRHGMVVAQMHDVTEITRVTITARRNEKQAVASVTLLPPPSLVTPVARGRRPSQRA